MFHFHGVFMINERKSANRNSTPLYMKSLSKNPVSNPPLVDPLHYGLQYMVQMKEETTS